MITMITSPQIHSSIKLIAGKLIGLGIRDGGYRKRGPPGQPLPIVRSG